MTFPEASLVGNGVKTGQLLTKCTDFFLFTRVFTCLCVNTEVDVCLVHRLLFWVNHTGSMQLSFLAIISSG